MVALSASITSRIEDGNIKTAIRLLSSGDKPAVDNDTTISALMEKHPIAAQDKRSSLPSRDFNSLRVSEDAVKSVIKSFPAGSGGGSDGVHPQHILDMTSNVETRLALLTSLTNFVNMLLRGECHREVIPILFGGSLIVLEKNRTEYDQSQSVILCAELLPNAPTILRYHHWAINYYPHSSVWVGHLEAVKQLYMQPDGLSMICLRIL